MASWLDGFYDNAWLNLARGKFTNNNLDYLYINNNKVYINPNKIYQLGSQPYPWDVPVGTRIFIDPDCLTGYGATLRPIEFITDGEVWLPYGEQVLYSKYGSYAIPVASDIQPATPTERLFFGADSWHRIPYQLMYLGLGVRTRFVGFKTGADANSTTFRSRLGQTSTGASGDTIVSAGTSAAAMHHISYDATARINVLGALTVAQFTTTGVNKLYTSGTPTTDGAGDRKTGFSTTKDNFVTISTSGAVTGAVANLLNFSISLVP